MPRKQWATYESLTAADVNTYLANQSVMVFASSAARSTAITSPTAGMVSYLTDTKVLQAHDGTSWVTITSASVPVPLTLGSSSNFKVATYDTSAVGGSCAGSTTANAQSAWIQITAGGLAADSLITSIVVRDTGTTWPEYVSFELAYGAAGSEQVVYAGPALQPGDGQLSSFDLGRLALPYAVRVPGSTRLAFRVTLFGFTGGDVNFNMDRVSLFYVENVSGTPTKAGMYRQYDSPTTANVWYEIAAAAPLSGAQIVGVSSRFFRDATGGELGLGAAGSEVVAFTMPYNANATARELMAVPPIAWGNGLRLAVRNTSQAMTPAATHIYWRETLA